MRGDLPSKKKIAFPVSHELERYLAKHGNLIDISLQYEDLLRYQESIPLLDLEHNDTLWRSVFYNEHDIEEISKELKMIYAYLKTDGDVEVMQHLSIARIDFCTHPFRIRIINRLNDNYDHFYIKKVDASRVYGLELENLISPNRFDYFISRSTLIEEHIAGIPGDDFMKKNLDDNAFNQIRMAKEFIKFNERCFVRLLGDMRPYNYVVDITPNIEGSQFRIRAIDFDQQSYEPRKSIYMPKYFKENMPIIEVGLRNMTPTTVRQYQKEERSMIASRFRYSGNQIKDLLNAMANSQLSKPRYVKMLAKDLSHHYRNNHFLSCRSMGEIVTLSLQILIDHN